VLDSSSNMSAAAETTRVVTPEEGVNVNVILRCRCVICC
jgi:hypothetical protein